MALSWPREFYPIFSDFFSIFFFVPRPNVVEELLWVDVETSSSSESERRQGPVVRCRSLPETAGSESLISALDIDVRRLAGRLSEAYPR